MRKLFCILILALASTLAYAQRPDQIELPCPAGFSPMPYGQAFNQSTNKIRRFYCIDNFGGIWLQDLDYLSITGGELTAPVAGSSALLDIRQTAATNTYGLQISSPAGETPNWNALYIHYTGTDHAIGVDNYAGSVGGELLLNHAGSGTWASQMSTADDPAGGLLELNGMSGQTGPLLEWTCLGNQTFCGSIGPAGQFETDVTNSNAFIVKDASYNMAFNVDSSAKTATSGGCFQVGGFSGPDWCSGAGAPPASCTVGSLYSNTNGGATTTLYVCTATNTWTAK